MQNVIERAIKLLKAHAEDDFVGRENAKNCYQDLERILIAASYQSKIEKWLLECFGPEIARDKTERCFRFTEESLELVQSLGITKEQVLQLVDYVYSRPIGEPEQEAGGVMVTMAALCFAAGLDMESAAVTEYERINLNIDKIRTKHFSKPNGVLSPIPGNSPATGFDDNPPVPLTEFNH